MTDSATFRDLLTATGAQALAAAEALCPTEAKFLKTYDSLRKHFPNDLAKAAVAQAILRTKAAVKFSRAGRMYFTREALEQASSEPVARHRAGRFRIFGRVLDIGCGVGGDALALAEFTTVTALDRDELRLAMAAENVKAYDRAAEFLRRDALGDELPGADAAFADPARRADGRRFLGIDDYTPPPAELLAKLPGVPFAFKLAPGVPWRDLETLGGSAEFVSLSGELKECVAWVRGWGGPKRRATLLPSGATMAADAPATCGVTEVREYLFDPDPAVSRSGLVPNLGNHVGATLVDLNGVLLTADEKTPTPFAVAYRVEAVLPLKPKVVGEVLKSRRIGRVTPLKRGALVDSDAWLRSWKLTGDEHRYLILTRSEAVLACI